MAGGFNANTRQFIRKQPNLVFTSVGSTQSADLPQVGYLASIILRCNLTLGTATGASGERQQYPLGPWNFLRRIRLSTNEGADIYNTSGWGNYLLMKTLRTGFDPAASTALFSLAGAAATAQSFPGYQASIWTAATQLDVGREYINYLGGVNGAAATSGTSDTVRWCHFIPVSWGEANLTGLVLMQNTGVRFTLTVDVGQLTDIWEVPGTAALSSLNITPELVFFSLPADPEDSPDLAFVRQVIEDIQPVTAVGDNVYKPRLGNIYTKIIQAWENQMGSATASTPIKVATSLRQPFDALRFSYAQSQQVFELDPQAQLFRQRMRYGTDLPLGVNVWDFSFGNGWPELPSSRDAIDTSRLTDMQLTTTLNASVETLTNAQVRTVSDMLVPVRG